jgi:hypothetical protein
MAQGAVVQRQGQGNKTISGAPGMIAIQNHRVFQRIGKTTRAQACQQMLTAIVVRLPWLM